MAATLQQKIDETFDQLDNIDSLCELFFAQSKFTIYKSISVSLRLLLTGSSGDVGLVQDVLPTSLLFRLRKIPDPQTPPDLLVFPAVAWIERDDSKMQLGNGTVNVKLLDVRDGAVPAMRFGDMFDNALPGITLVEWLKQPFLRSNWTLRDFITTVTNKDGGAHLNPNNAIQSSCTFRDLVCALRRVLWA